MIPLHRLLPTAALALALFPAALTARSETAPAPTITAQPPRHTFAIGETDFLLDAQKFQILCGEVHHARVPREYWRHRLQMVRAMGLNTVCAYLFWNQLEPRPGEFDWSGQADAAEFCRIAQQEGLWVILRPGPYACAEWDMGGTPWWLLKEDGVKMRSRDPRYLEPAKRYLTEVARMLAPLQITRGGPILMVQVENEYGYLNENADPEYMRALDATLKAGGFDVPFFACNTKNYLRNGLVPEIFQAVNFGSGAEESFRKLREVQTTGPLFCSEFYPGWFDSWGQPHVRAKGHYLPTLKTMLEANASFSIYMAHGGTTFGLWSGASRPFTPLTSSYDYSAPISEAAWVTPAFTATRELLSSRLPAGQTLPDVPAPLPVIAFAPVTLRETALVFDHLPAPLHDDQPRAMEKYDQGFGEILYRTTVPAGPAAVIEVGKIRDFGLVFLDGKRVGILDRRNPRARVTLPARTSTAQLDILVHPMGRVHFGPEIVDPKGLIAPVKLGGKELKSWEIFRLPLDATQLASLKFKPAAPVASAKPTTPAAPAFWRGTFRLEKAADTFLDLRGWAKGVVWVNGHCLGRYWNIGPTQTAFTPGCWLRAGDNEIVILDILGPENPVVAGLEKPILDELHPEKDFGKRPRANVALSLDSATPVSTGSFAADATVQDIVFAAPATGRYFCIEALNAHDGRAFAAIAELDLLGADGKLLSREGWSVAYVDSEEIDAEDGSAENAIDGQTVNFWHTEWKKKSPPYPHHFVLDLGRAQTLTGFRYAPRQGESSGRIKDYRIFVGDGLVQKK
jgi:beta-galactosidase